MIAQLARRSRLMNQAFMHESNARAALRLVEIRRRDHDCDSLTRQIRQRVPELAPGNRIDTGCGFIEQQNFRFDNQRARERKLLLHRSEEHTSELQSLAYLVCRLLLEKKK